MNKQIFKRSNILFFVSDKSFRIIQIQKTINEKIEARIMYSTIKKERNTIVQYNQEELNTLYQKDEIKSTHTRFKKELFIETIFEMKEFKYLFELYK